MDSERFDRLDRSLPAAPTRWCVLRLLAGGAFAALAAVGLHSTSAQDPVAQGCVSEG